MTPVVPARGLITALRRMCSASALLLVRAAFSPLPTSPLDLFFFRAGPWTGEVMLQGLSE